MQTVGQPQVAIEGRGIIVDRLLLRRKSRVTAPALPRCETTVLRGLITTTDTEIDPAIRHQVKECEVFRHTYRIVEWQNHHTGAKPDPLGTGRYRSERHLGRSAVAIFGEMMLGRPDRVEAKIFGLVHQRHLLVDDLPLGLAGRVPEQVQHAQLHGCSSN
jgi:hypothetical protein